MRVLNAADALFLAQGVLILIYYSRRSAATVAGWNPLRFCLLVLAAAVILLQHRSVWVALLASVGALCYRERLHIGVAVIPMMLKGRARIACGWLIEACMLGVNLFMFWYGIKLVQATPHQWISDFPDLISVGMSYTPVPLGGLITALFVIERIWMSEFFVEPSVEEISHVSTE